MSSAQVLPFPLLLRLSMFPSRRASTETKEPRTAGLNVSVLASVSVKGRTLLAADWIQLHVFLLPARSPFLH